MNYYLLLLFVLLWLKEASGFDVIFPEESDYCLEKLGERALCIEIDKCPIAKNLIKLGKVPYTCNFSGNLPFVCCAISILGQNATESECGIVRSKEKNNSTIFFPPDTKSEYGDSVIQPRSRNVSRKVKSPGKRWPWAVYIVRKNDSVDVCTGFLVDQFRIVTAAHCYSKESTADDYVVYVLKNEQWTPYAITELKIHQDFYDYYDDIAILKTSTAVEEVPVCLQRYNESYLLEKSATVVSWVGEEHGGVVSYNMQIVEVQICQEAYEMLTDGLFPYGVRKEFICAFPVNLTRDVCQVDSGGLLMIEEREKWFVVGIGTSGIPCDRPNYPAVFTNVSHYLEWLE